MEKKPKCLYQVQISEVPYVIDCQGKVAWRFWIDGSDQYKRDPVEAYACQRHSFYWRDCINKIAIGGRWTDGVVGMMKEEKVE